MRAERAGAEVEAGRPDDHVEFPMGVGRLDALWREPHHGCRLQVDQLHVGPVVDLEVGRDEGRALLAEPVILGNQPVRRLGVVDEAPDLGGEEVAPGRVGIAVEHHVAVVAGELREARAPPHLLEERGAFLIRVVEGGTIVRDVEESARRCVQCGADGLEVLPELHLLVRRDRCVVERRAPIGRALQHRQGGGRLGDDRDDLHPARPGAHDGDALAGEVDGAVRPQTRVVRLALELLPARNVGEVRDGEHTRGGHELVRPGDGAGVVGHRPQRGLLVVLGRRDAGVEAHVAPEVEPVHHVVQVALDLRLFGEMLPPLPILEQLP